MEQPADIVAAFLEAASVPLDGSSHTGGTLDRANELLEAHRAQLSHDLYAAATLGEPDAVERLVTDSPDQATTAGGPRQWDALTYLCFSRYLRLDKTRSSAFVETATILLDAGASATAGWFERHHQPSPEWESVLYGAAGVAHHPQLTRLLIERGADPNDNETVYHAPETYDNRAMAILVESGKLTADSLALMLVRKHDWHDYDGAAFLLEHGADPNRPWRPGGSSALHQALERGNATATIALLLGHGADSMVECRGYSALARAAVEGRADAIRLFQERGASLDALRGRERVAAACALGDVPGARAIVAREPDTLSGLMEIGGTVLAKFAGAGNGPGVEALLDLGVDVRAPFVDGDGYWGIPKGSLAIHVAAWRARHAVVRLLIDRAAPVDEPDANGRTPLALAIRACVDSYWREQRTTESVEALLRAGATAAATPLPTGYPEADDVLRAALR